MDLRDFRILHPHGDQWVELRREHHDATEHDVERRWGKGARIFRCTTCEEQALIIPPEEERPETR